MVSDYDNKTYLLRITSGTTMLAILLLAGNAYATAAIVGTWQYPEETITFYENGKFAGNNTQIGTFNGTYTTQGDILTLRYVFPATATAQFTFAGSGNTLQLSLISPQVTYTRVGTVTTTIFGTWQYPKETLTFYEKGKFEGNNTQVGVLNGTYTIQGNTLTLHYTFPATATAKFTFVVSGNTLQLSLQLPPAIYTGVDATPAAPTPTPTPTEPPENIVEVERDEKSLIANTPVTYTFKEPEHSISEITVTGGENQNDISISVEALKGTAKSVATQAPGAVYINLNIVVGTTKIKEAVIKFNVENSWLDGNNLASSDVRMIKWDGSKWNMLETTEKNKDATFTYYEAKTDRFSSFAITGLKAIAMPNLTETTIPTAVPTKKASGFVAMLVIGTLCAVYLFGLKRR